MSEERAAYLANFTPAALLEQLYEARNVISDIEQNKMQARLAAIPEEIGKILGDIETEYQAKIDAVKQNVAELEDAIKRGVLAAGATAKSTHLTAVWMKGRVTWDTSKLDGFCVAHPELAALRHEGEPSVTIRGVK